jgi:hypothetical protein
MKSVAHSVDYCATHQRSGISPCRLVRVSEFRPTSEGPESFRRDAATDIVLPTCFGEGAPIPRFPPATPTSAKHRFPASAPLLPVKMTWPLIGEDLRHAAPRRWNRSIHR